MRKLTIFTLILFNCLAVSYAEVSCGEGFEPLTTVHPNFWKFAKEKRLKLITKKSFSLKFESPQSKVKSDQYLRKPLTREVTQWRQKEINGKLRLRPQTSYETYGYLRSFLFFGINLNSDHKNWAPGGYELVKGHAIEITGAEEGGKLVTRSHPFLNHLQMKHTYKSSEYRRVLNKHFLVCLRKEAAQKTLRFTGIEESGNPPNLSRPKNIYESEGGKSEFGIQKGLANEEKEPGSSVIDT